MLVYAIENLVRLRSTGRIISTDVRKGEKALRIATLKFIAASAGERFWPSAHSTRQDSQLNHRLTLAHIPGALDGLSAPTSPSSTIFMRFLYCAGDSKSFSGIAQSPFFARLRINERKTARNEARLTLQQLQSSSSCPVPSHRIRHHQTRTRQPCLVQAS